MREPDDFITIAREEIDPFHVISEQEIDLALTLAIADGQSWTRSNLNIPLLWAMYGDLTRGALAWYRQNKGAIR